MTEEAVLANPSIMDAASFALVGFALVLGTLFFLWIMTMLLGQFTKIAKLDREAAPAATGANGAEAIPAATIALITAAVSFATHGASQIKSIRKTS